MAGRAPVPPIRAAVPYLVVRDATRAIAFYGTAFSAVVVSSVRGRDGRVGHAELRLGGGTIDLADEHPEVEDIVGPA